MQSDIELVRLAVANMVRAGPVHVVDAAKGYRLKLGQRADGSPYLSPWYPHPETGKTSVPLKVGQVVGVVNPGGDPRQGFLLRGGYSDGHKTPNDDMGANVFEDAGVRVEVAAGRLVVTIDAMTFTLSGEGLRALVGGVVHEVTGDGLATTGGTIAHDGRNIGSSHRHSGVVVGGSLTEGPV